MAPIAEARERRGASPGIPSGPKYADREASAATIGLGLAPAAR